MAVFSKENKKFYCECGCETEIPFYNHFVRGHCMRMPEARERQARLMIESCHTPEADRERKKSLEKYWDLLSPTEFWNKVEKGICSEACKEASAESHGTPEVRAKMSRKAESDWANYTSEEKEKRLKNSVNSEASKKASREAGRTPEGKAKKSRVAKLVWASYTPKEKAERIKNNPVFHSLESSQSPNGPETMLWKFLEQTFPGIFTPDWVERIDIGGRHPDFHSKDGRCKLVIESNGNYFHGSWGEEEQIAHYKKFGHYCIVVWADSAEDIIYEWPALVGKIRNYLGGIIPDWAR